MQQDRLDGWMVKQIENADLAKETVIQLPPTRTKSAAAAVTRRAGHGLPGTTPRRAHHGSGFPRLSITATAGQEMSSHSSVQSPRVTEDSSPRGQSGVAETPRSRVSRADESVETSWRAQFVDRRQPCVEGSCVDRTKVLHNMEKEQHGDEEQSPLFLWGLPREHILDFIKQSVLPSSWAMNHTARATGEWEAIPDEEDEAERVRRVISNVLALSSTAKSPSKPSSPRSPRSPRSPTKHEIPASPRGAGGISPRMSRAVVGQASPLTSNPMSPRTTPRSEDRYDCRIG